MKINDVVEIVSQQPKIEDVTVQLASDHVGITDTDVDYVTNDNGAFQLSKHAARQLYTKVGMPHHDRFREQVTPRLRGEALRQSMKAVYPDGKEFLLRTQGNTVLAFLTPKYRPYDNLQLATTTAEALESIPHEIEGFKLRDNRMSFRVNMPDVIEGVDGHELRGGVFISNSEIGDSGVNLLQSIYRLICSNGMLRLYNQQVQRNRHVKEQGSIESNIIDCIFELPKYVSEFTSTMRKAYFEDVPVDTPEELRQYIGGGHIISKKDSEAIWGLTQSIPKVEGIRPDNKWVVSQAIAQHARDEDDILQQKSLELLSAKLLERSY